MSDGLILFFAGIFLGAAIVLTTLAVTVRKPRPPDREEQREIIVKRTRPSFRDPSKTTVTSYERYKTRDGLYAPVKPGKGSQADERVIDR